MERELGVAVGEPDGGGGVPGAGWQPAIRQVGNLRYGRLGSLRYVDNSQIRPLPRAAFTFPYPLCTNGGIRAFFPPKHTRPMAPLKRLQIVWIPLAVLISALAPSTQAQSERKLLAHWRFDEPSGEIARDETGTFPGRLSPSGVTRQPQGIAGAALQFSRPHGGYVDIGEVLPLTDTPFSISVWFQIPVGDFSPVAGLVTKHRPGTGNGYGILFNEFNVPGAGERIAGFVGDYGFVTDFSVPFSPNTVHDDRWHHAVLSYNPTGLIRLYMDGAPTPAVRNARPAMISPARLVFGGIDTGTPQGTFTGALDDIQIYNFELLADEVAYLQANPGTSVKTQLDPVDISPNGGVFAGPVGVMLRSGIPGAELHYTLDNTDPVLTSARFTGFFTVTPPATLKARAFVNGFPVSEVQTAVFVPEPDVRIQPAGGLFTNRVDVTISTRIAGGILHYTLDGSEPTTASPRVEAPLRLTAATQIRARAFLNDFPVSQVAVADFVRIYADGSIPVSWLEQYFGAGYATDPRAAPNADPDEDGTSNLDEFAAKTHPLDVLSGFRAAIRIVPEVQFPSVAGQSYRILRRTSIPGEAPTLVTNLTATSPTTTYLDLSATANTGFYVIEPARE